MGTSNWGRRAFQVAAALSFPRLPGAPGEREARRRVKDFFEDAGLEVTEEYFHCSDFAIRVAARWALVPTGTMLVLAALLASTTRPALAIVFALGSLWPAAYVLSRVSAGFDRAQRSAPYRCANLVGRRAAPGDTNMNWVLMAHYDSKSQNFPIWLRVGLFLLAGAAALVLVVLITACAVVRVLDAPCVILPGLLPAALAGLALDLAFLANRVGNRSDGALDNAASVGIITEIADRLTPDLPEHINLWVVATAAEEIGLCGATAFLNAHRAELDPGRTVILNFDGGGAGRSVDVLAAHGIPRQKAPARLLAALRQAAADHGVSLREAYIPFGMATDLFPFTRAGYSGLDLIGIHGFFHTTRDRVDRINPDTIGDYVRVGYDLVRRGENQPQIGGGRRE